MRSTWSSATGRSPLWWAVWLLLTRTPSTSTSVWLKFAPRVAKSTWTPCVPRARTSTPAAIRTASAIVATGRRARSWRVMTRTDRVRVSKGTGTAAPVTTTVSWTRCCAETPLVSRPKIAAAPATARATRDRSTATAPGSCYSVSLTMRRKFASGRSRSALTLTMTTTSPTCRMPRATSSRSSAVPAASPSPLAATTTGVMPR